MKARRSRQRQHTYNQQNANGLLKPSKTRTDITEYFDRFPRFKEDPRFVSLCERASRGRKRASQDHGDEPPAQQRHLSPSTHENLPQHYVPQPPVASSSCVQLNNLPVHPSAPFQSLLVILIPFPLFEIIIIQGTSFYIEDNTIFNVYLNFRNTEYFERTNELVAEIVR